MSRDVEYEACSGCDQLFPDYPWVGPPFCEICYRCDVCCEKENREGCRLLREREHQEEEG